MDDAMTIAPVRLTVPGNHLMPGLLGPHDEWLEEIEKRFPETDILVRGNEIECLRSITPSIRSMLCLS